MNQSDAILAHLKTGQALTPIEALELYRCFRLAARIENLRKDGYEIETEIVHHNGKRYAKYFIKQAPVQLELIAS